MKLSVIIPVYNDPERLCQCLDSIRAGSRQPDELIVVDDGSYDSIAVSIAAVAKQFDANLVVSGMNRGPSFARNMGASHAQGGVLVFFDTDVLVHADTLAKMEYYLETHGHIDALFGSYDKNPTEQNMVSQYKNLMNHYVHHHALKTASTFWTACGAIRASAFHDAGGFDESFLRPTVEDIEFGMRLRSAGHVLQTFPDIQVTHTKKWTLWQMIRSDIFDRAIPWTRLILDRASMPNDLNLDYASRISAALLWMCVLCILTINAMPYAGSFSLVLFFIFCFLNKEFYSFYFKNRGLLFAIKAVFLHCLYFMYSSAVFGIVVSCDWMCRWYDAHKSRFAWQ